ncbi:hypothetical protein DYB25_011210 [Aphanomyces astaci]|uniref:Uncharacterized protein n=1 Tax=Aphanomyces astaci TaxID=112090 RepID=A0A396ZRJ7_APHAT|nr:hypothetical protein DYB25_011210 [Aphanomyces astaci]
MGYSTIKSRPSKSSTQRSGIATSSCPKLTTSVRYHKRQRPCFQSHAEHTAIDLEGLAAPTPADHNDRSKQQAHEPCWTGFKNELLSFMKDVSREEHIFTSHHMINFMKVNHKEWLDGYKQVEPNAYKSILRLKYAKFELQDIINVDETSVYYDVSSGNFWKEIGKSSKVDKTQKHSDRLTAVLTCRANDGKGSAPTTEEKK